MTDSLLDPPQDQPGIDLNKNYIEELVGEGKKFKTVEDLARGKLESDNYIKTLLRTQDELRADYLKVREENLAKAKLEELIDQIKPKQDASNTNTTNVNAETKALQLDPKQIESLVSTKIQEMELTRRQQDNYNTVKDRITERFGSNYQSAVKEQLESIGMSDDMFNTLARNEPKAVYRILGMDTVQQGQTFQTPPRSTTNASFAPKTPKRTWSYYQEMRKTNPALYNDPKTVVQKHRDMVELGKDFQDGNWEALG